MASLDSANSYTPGLDGVPPAAYKSTLDISGPLLFAAARELARTGTAPQGFNHSILRTTPKKAPAAKPKDTRPLQTPNGDNRIIAKAELHAISEAVYNLLQPNQKAFIPGKDFTDHIRDLSGLYYSSLSKKDQHAILFLDMEKAFDKLLHPYIFALLKHIGLPPHHISLIVALFTNLAAVPTIIWVTRLPRLHLLNM
jgi:hypothetical protein